MVEKISAFYPTRCRHHLQDQRCLLHHQGDRPITFFFCMHSYRSPCVTDMLEALLKRKLPGKMENMEDVLTSMIFGAFRREPTGRRIFEFLNKAIPISGSNPDFAKCCQVKYNDYEFWPQWPTSRDIGSCEPDVFIRIDRDKEKPLYVLIEAKYHSGISSPPTTDGTINHQLAKEWCHLKRIADKDNAEPWMIYLTKDFGPSEPRKAIQDAFKEIRDKQGNAAENDMHISWLSWRILSDLYINESETALRDISDAARCLGLVWFQTEWCYEILPQSNYKFDNQQREFSWPPKVYRNTWRFSA